MGKFPIATQITGRIAATKVGQAVANAATKLNKLSKWTSKKLHLEGLPEEYLEEWLDPTIAEAVGVERRGSEQQGTNPVSRAWEAQKEFFTVESRGVDAKLKAWITEVWSAFKSAFGIADLTAEQIETMTLDQFVDYVKSRVEEGDPAFDLDWETAKEIERMRAQDALAAQDVVPYEGEVPFSVRRPGEARMMAKQIYDPEAKVSIIDGRNAPVFKELTTKEIKDYLRDKYQGLEVTIRADGLKVEFTRKGVESSLKKRGIHREAYHVLDKLVKESRFTRYEVSDGQGSIKASTDSSSIRLSCA